MKSISKFFLVIAVFSLSLSAFSQNLGALRLFDRGVAKQNSEDYYGASEDFQQALQANPSYGEAWFHLSQVTYSLGDYSLALTYLDEADKYAKNRTDIQNLKGLILIALGRLDEARTVFSDVLKKYPNDIDSRFGLAELDLFTGSFIGAKNQYEDALKRQGNNRKALLSLALISEEMGNHDTARKYIEQALRYHSGEAEVHYLAGYLDAKQGKFAEAEKRARAAVQINPDYTKAYVLLSSILYAQKKYSNVIDLCDYLIEKNRNTSEAWYLKGLSQNRRGDWKSAISTWSTALTINPYDEVMRSGLELLIMKNLPVEDASRAEYASFHAQKGREFAKSYFGEEARYEYQRALKINPYDDTARAEFATLLGNTGLNENYLNQLKFIKQNQERAETEKSESEKAGTKLTPEQKKVNDTIEAYESLMKYSLAAKWNVDPFYLDKTRWHVGLYYTKSPVQLLHCDAEEIAAGMCADIFSGIASTSVAVQNQPVSGYGEAYRLARNSHMDYFVLLAIDESEREITLSAVVYSARTGTETAKFSSFRTGNDKFSAVLRAFRRDLLDILPVRGKILQRSVNEILVDLGSVEGMKADVVLDVIKAGKIVTNDKGLGVTFEEKNLLGTIKINRAGEEISQGTLSQTGFYDRVNVGDEVLVKFRPDEKSAEDAQISENAPAAGENGSRILPEDENAEKQKKLDAREMGLIKTPAIIQLIRGLKN
ncbi:MAG: tetratricopeptide repeat protein [Treponema sp.]|uniref:tetratricopeptide repeat protein n=1 Tax=Treponema sp. TaxID=166 RepID=UPI0025F9563F|nr:tetratricopeptide repeat protein [Treponema sp.]MBQ8681167.1 tetratricopeptide repeat protein [Treponema sp.]